MHRRQRLAAPDLLRPRSRRLEDPEDDVADGSPLERATLSPFGASYRDHAPSSRLPSPPPGPSPWAGTTEPPARITAATAPARLGPTRASYQRRREAPAAQGLRGCLELGTPPVQQGAHGGHTVDAAVGIGFGDQVLTQHREIVVVAEEVGQLVELLATSAQHPRPQVLQQPHVVAVVLHALAPQVERLGGRLLVGVVHAVTRTPVRPGEPALDHLEVVAVDLPPGDPVKGRGQVGLDGGEALLELRVQHRGTSFDQRRADGREISGDRIRTHGRQR